MNKDFFSSDAYRLACLGETSTTWEALGHACIEQGELNLAKKCFSRIRDVKYLNLLANYEVRMIFLISKIKFSPIFPFRRKQLNEEKQN